MGRGWTKATVVMCVVLFWGQLEAAVYRLADDALEELIPTSLQGVSTPDALVMKPGIYGYNGPSYDCTEEGIYRFYTLGSSSSQRLVFTQNIDRLMSSISWLVCHGFKDDLVGYSGAIRIAKERKLHMTCGSIANFTVKLLTSLGVKSRFILFLTLQPWNNYTNGHSLVEVFQDGQWVVWDVDLRNRFEQHERRLNAWELKQALLEDDFELIKFSRAPILAFGDLKSNKYDFTAYLEENFLFEEQMRNLYRNRGHVLFIRQEDLFYFTCNPADKARVKKYNTNVVYLDEDTFLKKFYPSMGIIHD